MSRTYIGPFGRILPLLGDKEPEQQSLPVDETRTNMTTFQLPPPERLQFGSDATPGFTEPMRYNTISQSIRTHEPNNPSYNEQPQSSRREQLPAISHLFKPGSRSSAPPSPYSPHHSPRRPTLPSDGRSSVPDQNGQGRHYATYQGSSTASRLPAQAQLPADVNQRRDGYRASPTTQQFPSSSYIPLQVPNLSSYRAYPEQNPQMASTPQTPRLATLSTTQPQQVTLMNTPLPQPVYPVNASLQYYQDHSTNYTLASSPALSPEQDEKGLENTIKPLPRLVGERNVPGEGPSWVYEDGTTCKKVIDGEPVNAQWGVTKAGKPRKRLAIACTTCREKKIKCDPASPKCLQCEKFGRDCRFTTAFRNQRNSPETPSYDFQARAPSIKIKTETPSQKPMSLDSRPLNMEDQIVLKRRKSSPEMCDGQTQPDGDVKVVSNKPPIKKQRSTLVGPVSPEQERKRCLAQFQSKIPPSNQSHLAPGEELPTKTNVDSYNWSIDPYHADDAVTGHYMDMYFIHVNAATYPMFPRRSFMRWVQNSKIKSPADLMTIYAMLAVGSIFSFRAESHSEGSLFAQVAKYAVEKSHGDFSLQLTHSRLLLALYDFSLGDSQSAWDYGGMAIRAASVLKLNLENECQNIRGDEVPEYGLSRNALIECRRRTFWSAYMTDRFSGICSGHLFMLQSEDTYLRLPCSEQCYEDSGYVNTPYFDNGVIDPQLCQADGPLDLGPMAYSALLSSVWGDVLTHIYRSSYQAPEKYIKDYEAFYACTHRRLESWMRGLPSHLIYSDPNTKASIYNGSVGSYISLHALYHATVIKLNRNIRHAYLPATLVMRNLDEADHHARGLLQMMQIIDFASPEESNLYVAKEIQQGQLEFALSIPFVGYAILTAIDTISSRGLFEPKAFTNNIQMMNSGLGFVEKQSRFWASARGQRKAITQRIEELAECARRKGAEKRTAWICKSPLDTAFGLKQEDAIYGTDNTYARSFLHLERLGVKAREDDILLVGQAAELKGR